MKNMKNKDLFLKALNTLMFSWGSDAPAEAHWALSELLDFYEAETGIKIDAGEYDEDGNWAVRVIEELEKN